MTFLSTEKVINPDLNQSVPITLNDDQRSPTDDKSDTNLAILPIKNQVRHAGCVLKGKEHHECIFS